MRRPPIHRSLDANVAYEFYAGNYRKSLNALLGRTETDDTPPPSSASPTAKTEIDLKNTVDKLSREMFDCGMRTCVKLNDSQWAGYLADAGRKYVSPPLLRRHGESPPEHDLRKPFDIVDDAWARRASRIS